MSNPFTAALLTGGKSVHNGKEKLLLEWEGHPLWQRQLRLLEELHPEQLLISGPLDGPYAGTPHEIIPDIESGMGPLSAFDSLLSSCRNPRLLVLDLDLPWMTSPVLEQLLSFQDGIVPERQGRWEPLAAVYPVDILPLLRNTLQSPNRSVNSLICLALNNGFIDTWTVPSGLEKCFENSAT